MTGDPRRWRLLFAALTVAGIALLGAGDAGAAQQGDPAPDYSARLLGTETRAALSDLRGEVVLLNTWATWCEPCREEMPGFEAFYQRHRGEGLVVVGVNIDEGRTDGVVSRFLERAGITFPVWRDPSNRFGKTFRVLGPPETFLVDRDGQVGFHWRGQMDPEEPANRARILGALHADGPAAAGTSAAAAVAGAGLLVAFGAGLVSVLSPCVLPLIPSYASVIAGVSMRRERREARQPAMAGAPGPGIGIAPAPDPARRTALAAGISFVAGFSAVFMTLGVLVNRAGAALADHRVWLTRAGGVVLVVLGLHLVGLLRIGAADREVRFLNKLATPAGLPGVFLVGVAFAAGWSPCVGPVLAGILTMAASGGSTLEAAGLLAAYCAGLAVPFLAAAVALDRFLVWSSRLRRSWLPVAERVSGALVLAVGLLLLTGIFTRLASWLA